MSGANSRQFRYWRFFVLFIAGPSFGCAKHDSSTDELDVFPPLEVPLSNVPKACVTSSLMGRRPQFKETLLDFGAGNFVVTGVSVGLLDRDNYPDLVVSGSVSTSSHIAAPTFVTVRNGRQRGVLSEPSKPLELGLGSRSITLADIDGNGRHDIAANGSYCMVTSSGRCNDIQVTPAVPGGSRFWGYANSDAYVDAFVLSTQQIYTHLGRGDSDSFQETMESPYEGPYLYWNIVGDVNGDGHADIIGLEMPNESSLPPGEEQKPGSIQVLLGNGTGHFSWKRSWTRNLLDRTVHLAGGDFNCDGLLDIATAVSNPDKPTDIDSRVQIWLSKGSDFEEPINIQLEGPVWIAVGDMNGDGHHDLVVANSYFDQQETRGAPVVLLGNGSGRFDSDLIRLESSGRTQSLYIVNTGDINNDGLDDVLAGDRNFSDQVSIWVSEL